MHLSPTQREIMWALDGPCKGTFIGRYRRSADALMAKGLVTIYPIKEGGRRYVEVHLTREGSDFIYNGGLDH